MPEWYEVKDLCDALRVSRSTLFAWIREGRIPPPVKFGARTTRWRREVAEGLIRAGPGPSGAHGGRVQPVEDLDRAVADSNREQAAQLRQLGPGDQATRDRERQ